MVPCIIIIVIRKGEERRKREKFYIYSDVTHTHVYSERKTSSVTSEVKPIGVSWNGKPPGGTGITWRQTFQKHHARAATPKPSQTIRKRCPEAWKPHLPSLNFPEPPGTMHIWGEI